MHSSAHACASRQSEHARTKQGPRQSDDTLCRQFKCVRVCACVTQVVLAATQHKLLQIAALEMVEVTKKGAAQMKKGGVCMCLCVYRTTTPVPRARSDPMLLSSACTSWFMCSCCVWGPMCVCVSAATPSQADGGGTKCYRLMSALPTNIRQVITPPEPTAGFILLVLTLIKQKGGKMTEGEAWTLCVCVCVWVWVCLYACVCVS